MMPREQNADLVRRNREVAGRVRRRSTDRLRQSLAEVIAQLAAEYEARPEHDTLSVIEDRAEELRRLAWELER